MPGGPDIGWLAMSGPRTAAAIAAPGDGRRQHATRHCW